MKKAEIIEVAEKLRGFARDVFMSWPDIDHLDGFDLQEMGIKHGILLPIQVDEPCGELCACADYYELEEFPVTCYELADFMTMEKLK